MVLHDAIVKGRKRKAAAVVHGLDFLSGEHHVFGIGDQRAQAFDVTFGGKFPHAFSVNGGEQSGNLLFVGEKRKGCTSGNPFVLPNDSGTYAVDGAKFQPFSQLRSKEAIEAGAHIGGGGYGIGHSQDILRRNISAEKHVP